MADSPPAAGSGLLPTLSQLGADFTRVTIFRRLVSLALPFAWCSAYFVFAALGWWPAAVFALVALSFVTYGSVSHDLVHRTLGLPRWGNDFWLCLIELLALRSGHAYRATHLHHHARFPHSDDMEADAARRSCLGALAAGLTFQFRVWWWAVRNARRDRTWVIGEGLTCVLLVVLAAVSSVVTPVFLVYVLLMVMGSWLIPLVTAYVPHDPDGKTELFQTRAYRGVMASVLALEHLYHLEHHLYPAVPHHHWPRLARCLDPYLEKAGVKPVKFWF